MWGDHSHDSGLGCFFHKIAPTRSHRSYHFQRSRLFACGERTPKPSDHSQELVIRDKFLKREGGKTAECPSSMKDEVHTIVDDSGQPHRTLESGLDIQRV